MRWRTRPAPSAAQLVRWLARRSPFAELPEETLATLPSLLVRTEARPGETIYSQGDRSDTLFVVGRGRVEVLTEDDDGAVRIVNTVAPGQVLGLSSFSRHSLHSTSARAASEAVVFKLTRGAYETIVANG